MLAWILEKFNLSWREMQRIVETRLGKALLTPSIKGTFFSTTIQKAQMALG
jgi:hypothetical protein